MLVYGYIRPHNTENRNVILNKIFPCIQDCLIRLKRLKIVWLGMCAQEKFPFKITGCPLKFSSRGSKSLGK
jgi:hypothetical protein